MRSTLSRAGKVATAPVNGLESFGRQLAFHGQAYGWIVRAMRRYKKEILRLIAEVSLGTGGLAVIGGTVVVVMFMTGAIGVEVGLQGHTSPGHLGGEGLSGVG